MISEIKSKKYIAHNFSTFSILTTYLSLWFIYVLLLISKSKREKKLYTIYYPKHKLPGDADPIWWYGHTIIYELWQAILTQSHIYYKLLSLGKLAMLPVQWRQFTIISKLLVTQKVPYYNFTVVPQLLTHTLPLRWNACWPSLFLTQSFIKAIAFVLVQ
jgi:hypothetical protein